jgi:PKD repeat protein
LACDAGIDITNDSYHVVSSDQGVDSQVGAPVSITVLEPTITVSFTYSANAILEGSSVDFTADATTDGLALTYEWDFGDGGTGTGQNPSHTYATAGTFDVTLTVTDGCGFSKSVTIKDAVTVTSACTALSSVDFAYSPAMPYLNTSVSFNATPQPPLATQPITYTWDFDDGTNMTGTDATIQHVFTDDDTYTVRVTATNSCTPAGVTGSKQVVVVLYKIYLPLAVR